MMRYNAPHLNTNNKKRGIWTWKHSFHHMFIHKPTTNNAPHGPMTRTRARTIEIEVNSLLLEKDMDMNETWLLPHQNMLCVIRYEDRRHQAAAGCPKGGGEAPQGIEEEEG
uniref:Uncharacterized protein n=1 Tax=Triticum urartu TaxID=4572 RepID=A0A8R7UWJ9_TRIUA